MFHTTWRRTTADRSERCAQAVAPLPRCSTAMTRPSTSCAASRKDRLRGHPPRPQPLGQRDRHGAAGRRPRHRDHLPPGGTSEFFKHMIDLLREKRRREHQGLRRRWRRDRAGRNQGTPCLRRHPHLSPEDGAKMGLQGMINDRRAALRRLPPIRAAEGPCRRGARRPATAALALIITALENGACRRRRSRAALIEAAKTSRCRRSASPAPAPASPRSPTSWCAASASTRTTSLKLAIISIDPSPQIRRRAARRPHPHERHRASNIFMRSLATRDTGSSSLRRAARSHRRVQARGLRPGHRRNLRHRPGRRRHRALRRSVALRHDPEFGAASQLEKIDMLDFADFVAINKFDRKGRRRRPARCAKQYQRNREAVQPAPRTRCRCSAPWPPFQRRRRHCAVPGPGPGALAPNWLQVGQGKLPLVGVRASSRTRAIVPAAARYLAEIADTCAVPRWTPPGRPVARERQALRISKGLFEGCKADRLLPDELIEWKDGELTRASKKLLDMWPKTVELYAGRVRGEDPRQGNPHRLTSAPVPVRQQDPQGGAAALRGRRRNPAFLMKENVPGSFPFTAGVFAFKREGEDPTRMFAGEATPSAPTAASRRCPRACPRIRLSTAFDSVTLYGCDPDRARTSTARSATPACPSPRWTT